MEGFGFAMGIYAVLDMSGLDIAWAQRKARAADRPATSSRQPGLPTGCARRVGSGERLARGGTTTVRAVPAQTRKSSRSSSRKAPV